MLDITITLCYIVYVIEREDISPVGAVDQREQLVSLTSNKAVPWLRKRECDTQGRLQPVEGSWEPLAFILKLFKEIP